jgi:CBS domain-containing protein
MKIVEVMTREVETCNETDSVVNAAKLMEECDIGSIPVIDNDGQLCGILTDRDIAIRGVAKEKDLSRTTCGELMTDELICCQPDTEVHQAMDILAEHQIRRLPVVDDNKRLIGICAIGDLAVQHIYIDDAGRALNSISQSDATLQ